ncbi:MAG: alkaline phosphatase [Thermoanaerobaculaceae bacterium]
MFRSFRLVAALFFLVGSSNAQDPSITVVSPPANSSFAAGQRFDVLASFGQPEQVRWQVLLDGKELSAQTSGQEVRVENLAVEEPGEHTLTFVALRSPRRSKAAVVVAQAQQRFQIIGWPAEKGKVKHVFLFIGDGMGLAHRTAARAFLYGFSGGKSQGFLTMDQLPVGGFLITSSLSGFVTDSAAGAHAFATGTKTANGMMGLFPDGTAEDTDNPKVESLPCLLYRTRGLVSGLVTDADLTDATPAAFLAQVADRGNASNIASQFLHRADQCGVRVLLGGGQESFTKPKDLLPVFGAAGFSLAYTAEELKTAQGEHPQKLLGLFAPRHMHSPFDLQSNGTVTAENSHQPSLAAMTEAALAVLKENPAGFFLMVEGALIDKQAHMLDAERMLWDLYNLDQAIQVALRFAEMTNADEDPTNDTLIIVTADHETGGVVLPGILDVSRLGTRDQVATYDRLGFPEAADANKDGYPDNPNPAKKLVVHFGAAPDHFDDFQSQPKPIPPARAGEDKKVHANPEKDGKTGVLYSGVSEISVPEQGYPPDRGVHTGVDVPLSALGPGADRLGGVHDNTEVFFAILKALAPPQSRS